MAAVIEFRPADRHALPRPAAPTLRVIHGGRSPVVRRRRRVFLLRRALVLAAAALVVVLLVSALRGVAGAGASTPGGAPSAEYVVRAGDTMWSIAAQVAPTDDRRQVVEELVAANGGRTSLDVGQVVRVPASLRGA